MAIIRCNHTWTDGWGEHICTQPKDSDHYRHRCDCDAVTRNTDKENEA